MKDAMQIAATGIQTQQRLVRDHRPQHRRTSTLRASKRSKVSFAELVAGSPSGIDWGCRSLLRVGVLRWSSVRMQSTMLSFAVRRAAPD